jgi:hypothetical protein
MAASCGFLRAQTEKTITIRILDGKTGKLIVPSNFLVRIDHEEAIHTNWVVKNEDGTGKLTVPQGASLLSIQGSYDSSMDIYFSCDSVNGKEPPIDRWYAVSEILAAGIVAPDGCKKPAAAAKFMPAAKHGEFVFFVRKLSTREKFLE